MARKLSTFSKTFACFYCSHLNKTTTYEDPRKWLPIDPEDIPEPRIVDLTRDQELGFGFVAGSEKPVIVRYVYIHILLLYIPYLLHTVWTVNDGCPRERPGPLKDQQNLQTCKDPLKDPTRFVSFHDPVAVLPCGVVSEGLSLGQIDIIDVPNCTSITAVPM